MNGGAEAIDLAIKIARLWGYRIKSIESGKALVLTCEMNYHGRTLAPLSGSSNEKLKTGPSLGKPLKSRKLLTSEQTAAPSSLASGPT